jgi:cytochrome P450 PksS
MQPPLTPPAALQPEAPKEIEASAAASLEASAGLGAEAGTEAGTEASASLGAEAGTEAGTEAEVETERAGAARRAPLLSGAPFKADPHGAYAALRDDAPVFCRVSADGMARMWFLTRYEDVTEALRDYRRYVKDVQATLTPQERAAQAPEPPLYRLLTQHMLNADGATHARLRGLVNKAFTVRMVEQLTPQIEQIAMDLLRKAAPHGRMDVIEEFALPLAVDVIGELLGMGERDHHRLRAWSHVLVAPSASPARNEAKTAKLRRVMEDFVVYLRELCEARRRAPRRDLISSLLLAEEAGDRLSEEELYSMVLLIVVVGHETSVHLIGNAVYHLLLRPDLWAYLRSNPTHIPAYVEELIRFDGPVERATMRFAAEDIALHGQTIRRGDAVSLVLAAAHRDERAFACPAELDITRSDNRHLGFGQGVHYCLGAPLARVEAQVALEALLTQFRTLTMAVPQTELRWHTNPILHGLRRLPVRGESAQSPGGRE